MLFYYSRKYAVYNLTIYESLTQEVFCYTWGEADGKRGGNVIATILTKYIKMVDERQTVKNLLQNVFVFKTLKRNFLVPGHTNMPVYMVRRAETMKDRKYASLEEGYMLDRSRVGF